MCTKPSSLSAENAGSHRLLHPRGLDGFSKLPWRFRCWKLTKSESSSSDNPQCSLELSELFARVLNDGLSHANCQLQSVEDKANMLFVLYTGHDCLSKVPGLLITCWTLHRCKRLTISTPKILKFLQRTVGAVLIRGEGLFLRPYQRALRATIRTSLINLPRYATQRTRNAAALDAVMKSWVSNLWVKRPASPAPKIQGAGGRAAALCATRLRAFASWFSSGPMGAGPLEAGDHDPMTSKEETDCLLDSVDISHVHESPVLDHQPGSLRKEIIRQAPYARTCQSII